MTSFLEKLLFPFAQSFAATRGSQSPFITRSKNQATQQPIIMKHRNSRPRLLFAAGLISLSLFPISANAATVAFAGVINNDAGSQITEWKTTATTKTLDADGDNEYGTLAHLFYGIEFKGQNTLYTFDGSDFQVGPFGGYATVDSPNGGADVQVRTTTNGGANDSNRVMFTFTALVGSPASVRIGVATDGLDSAFYSSATIGLREVGGSSFEYTMTSTNATLDMAFFDVTGITAGDQFEVFGDSGTGGYATHQFITWDVIPEPSTALLGGLGALALLRRRR